MNRFVVDASVVAKWLISEPDTADALSLRGAEALIAPDLIVAECANILWKAAKRGELPGAQALLGAELLEHADLDLRPMGALVRAATGLAIDLDHPAYDCFYLALAVAEDCPFVTADVKLARKVAQGRRPDIVTLSLAEAATLVGPQARP